MPPSRRCVGFDPGSNGGETKWFVPEQPTSAEKAGGASLRDLMAGEAAARQLAEDEALAARLQAEEEAAAGSGGRAARAPPQRAPGRRRQRGN